jgi:hypothetical protein
MRNPVDRIRQRLARRRYRPRVPRRRASTTAKLGLFALVVIGGTAMVLELRGRAEETALLEYAGENAVAPMDLVVAAGRGHRLLFLGDVPGAVAPKRLAADAVDTLAAAFGLDALVLDVDAREQPWIDRYLETSPEDASILVSRSRAVKEADGTASAYLDLYRRVRALNERLGPDRRVHIIAADLPDWPPERAASLGQAVERFGQRDAHMFQTVQERLLERSRRARVLFFLDGLHVLKGRGVAVTGGTPPARVVFAAAQFDRAYPGEVYSILVDAPAVRAVGADVARYRSTGAADVLRERAAGGAAVALPVDAALQLGSDAVRAIARPGVTFELTPPDYRLADLIDAYIYLVN